MSDLGPFEAGLAGHRRVLASLRNPEAVLVAFTNAAHEVARYVSKGLDRAVAADQLIDMATTYGLTDMDLVQDIVSQAFVKIKKAKAPHGNGHGKVNGTVPREQAEPQIPTVCPFPLDGSTIPRRPWIVPGLLLRRHVTLLVAPPGSGKSLLTLQLAMLCTGALVEWATWKPRGKFRSLLINVEEDEDEMRRRLFAAAAVMKIEHDQLTGLYLAKADDIVVAKADNKTKTVVATPMIESIIATIKQLEVDIVIVDPFAETFVGDENSNSELKWAGVLWRRVARETNTAVLLVHHAKKYSGNMAGDPDAGRGGGSLVGIARIVATLFTMTDKEANRFNIAKHRHKYIRFDDAKTNLTLIGNSARWFEKETFKLNNAGGGEPADEVGVLSPWSPPAWRPDDPTTDRMLEVIEAGVLDEDGRPTGDLYTRTKKGKLNNRWAGTIIMQTLECDEDEAKTLIAEWIDDKLIEEVDEPTSRSKGSKRKGLRVIRRDQGGDMSA
jgi:hypothetical protein